MLKGKRNCLDVSNVTPLIKKQVLKSDTRDFQIRRRDGNENVKKRNRFKKQNNNFARASRFFLYILLPFVHDYGVKMPDLAFYGGRKQATTKLLFLFLNLDVVLTTSTPGVVHLHLTKYVDGNNRDED